MSGLVEGDGGNREVPALDFLGTRRDLRAARAEAYLEEEGGSWGKHGFPRGSEPKASDERGAGRGARRSRSVSGLVERADA